MLVRELLHLIEYLVELGLRLGFCLLGLFVGFGLLRGLFLGLGVDDNQVGRIVFDQLKCMFGTNLDTGAAA